MIFALSGNPNCGKTTLYNVLTGSNRRVGNFAGVTVDVKSGESKKYGFTVVDLPGIYSLFPYSAEEKLAGDYLLNSRPNGIIDVVDATNPERNLYLTLQLLELGIPVIVALNMIDEAEKNGVSVNAEKLSSLLGVPVVSVSALKKTGIKELVSVAKKNRRKTRRRKPFSRSDYSRRENLSRRFYLSEKLVRFGGLRRRKGKCE